MLVLFWRRGCGGIERPEFPAPSDLRGQDVQVKLARKARRDREAVSANVRCLKIEIRLSSSAKVDDPVFRSDSDGIDSARRTGYPPFSGDYSFFPPSPFPLFLQLAPPPPNRPTH